jgi:hypothetical protein
MSDHGTRKITLAIAIVMMAAACDTPATPPQQAKLPASVAPATHGRVETQRFHSDALGVD